VKSVWITTAVLLSIVLGACLFAQVPGAGVGQELKKAEQDVKKVGLAPDHQPAPATIAEDKPSSNQVPPEVKVAGNVNITAIELRGDVGPLEERGLADELRISLVNRQMTSSQISAAVQPFKDKLIKGGFFLARIRPVDHSGANGVVILDVDLGRYGKMSFFRKDDSGSPQQRKPFEQRYYSEAQLRRMLGRLQESEIFDYNEFYRRIFDVNSSPDVVMDTKLKPRVEKVGDRTQSFADMEFAVRESLPLHAVLDVNNAGTKSTSKWRESLAIQDSNLTRHSDVLTLRAQTSPDMSKMRSFAASYDLPYYLGNGGELSAYGGYADTDAGEVINASDITVQGRGSFGGLQGSYKLIDSGKHLLSVGLSAVYRDIRNDVLLAEQAQVSSAEVLPAALTISYSSASPDFLNGRNFLTSEYSYNLGDGFGLTDDDDMSSFRSDARTDYWVERLHVGRFQPLFGVVDKDAVPHGQWMLLVKMWGQYASGVLIPAEELAIGGMDSVRGYQERGIAGDDGLMGTIELRTPQVSGLLSRSFKSAGGVARFVDRAQIVAFADGGQVHRRETFEDEKSNESIYGVGAGLRWSFARQAQVRFDSAYRLNETALDPDKGFGYHVDVQLQF
jgi:hemolysin activation/secretion protein